MAAEDEAATQAGPEDPEGAAFVRKTLELADDLLAGKLGGEKQTPRGRAQNAVLSESPS